MSVFALSCELTMHFIRKKYKLDVKVRARALTTVPDSTSQKFLMLGQIARKDQKADQGKFVTVFLDFAETRSRQCGASDFENWYARTASHECLMGHKVRHTSRPFDDLY